MRLLFFSALAAVSVLQCPKPPVPTPRLRWSAEQPRRLQQLAIAPLLQLINKDRRRAILRTTQKPPGEHAAHVIMPPRLPRMLIILSAHASLRSRISVQLLHTSRSVPALFDYKLGRVPRVEWSFQAGRRATRR